MNNMQKDGNTSGECMAVIDNYASLVETLSRG